MIFFVNYALIQCFAALRENLFRPVFKPDGYRVTLHSNLPAALAPEMIGSELKQHIKTGEAAVNSCDVLLQINLFFVAHATAINPLFHNPEPVAHHNDLMKKRLDWYFFRGQVLLSGLQNHRSTFPFISQINPFPRCFL